MSSRMFTVVTDTALQLSVCDLQAALRFFIFHGLMIKRIKLAIIQYITEVHQAVFCSQDAHPDPAVTGSKVS